MRELLILLSHYPFREESREKLAELISEASDWKKTVELINSHGIIALAAYNIKVSHLEKNVPAEAMTVLENGFRQSLIRNTWLAERWKEVNTILCDAGIKHVLLKGMALEHTLYGSKGLRQMNDNDILIKKDEAVKAWDLLRDHGYLPEIPKSAIHKKLMLHLGKHLPCLYKDGYAVEIHHSLFGDDDDLVDEAVEINVRGTTARMLSPGAQLKHLIGHFERHALEGDCQLRLYTDIKLLDESAPVEISDSFIENPIQSCKREFQKAAYRINLKSIDPQYRSGFLLGDIFPSVEWMKQRYKCGTVRAMLYYPHRIGKLGWLL